MSSQHWILKLKKWDMLFILFPGIIGAAVLLMLPEASNSFVIYGFIAYVLIDTGHVYTTFWRTIFRKEERSSHAIYWQAPIIIFVVVFIWILLRVAYLWSAVVYLTIFHHIRQFYGMSRWYQKLNGRFCKTTNFFLYALLIGPFIIFHFRSIPKLNYYTSNDIFFLSSPLFLKIGLIVYGLIVLSWLIFELRLWKKGVFEPNRFFSICAPALLYLYCFLIASNMASIILPLLIAHGIPYFAIMDVSLHRLNPSFFKGTLKILSILLATALLFALLEFFIEKNFLTTLNEYYPYQPKSIFQAALTAVYLMPLLCHFVWDAHIWRGKHREAKIIFH